MVIIIIVLYANMLVLVEPVKQFLRIRIYPEFLIAHYFINSEIIRWDFDLVTSIFLKWLSTQ